MPENQSDTATKKPKYWRLFELGAATIYAASIVVIIAILRHPEWHDHLLRLMGRAWEVFVSQDVGSTGRGFVSGCLEAFFGIAAVAAMTGYFLGWKELQKHWIETAIIALFALPTVTLVIYGTQFVWEVAKAGYQDHQTLTAKVGTLESEQSHMVDPSGRDATITDLRNQLKASQLQLAARKQMVGAGDPAFDNIRRILEAFQAYRIMSKGQRCYVYMTTPSPSPIVTMFSEFSNSVSGCFTFSSWEGTSQEADEEIKDGMKPGVVLIHAPREDTAANRVEEALSGIIPVERSYKLLSTTFPHYQGQTANDLVLWLQFGPDMHWSSEIRQKENR